MSSNDLTTDPVLHRVPVREGYKVLGGIALYQRIGHGNMGVVYKGRHVRLGSDLAVKVMTPPSWLPRELTGHYVDRLKREARLAAAIDHPNLIRVLDVDSEGDTYFLVMEYVDGESGDERLVRKGPLSETEALLIALAAAEGLAAAHRKGIVHRDVKPANIMIDKSGKVRVADLGMAKAVIAGSQVADMGSLTATQDAVGSPRYMPLEQYASSKTVGPQVDVWSLGITLYELLTGRSPWSADNALGLIAEMQGGSPLDVREARPGVNEDIAALIGTCLQRKPEDRFGDCVAMAEAMREVVRGLGVENLRVEADPDASPAAGGESATAPPATSVLDAISRAPAENVPDPMDVTADLIHTITPEVHKCPMCGKRNKLADTFECRTCFRDHLCARHLDESANECTECADASSRREVEKERRLREAEKKETETRAAVRAAAAKGRLRKVVFTEWPFAATEAARRRAVTADVVSIPRVCSIDVGDTITLDAALIPAGQFAMGSWTDDDERNSNEAPQHDVEISRPFYLGVYPVTQAQYQAVTDKKPSRVIEHDAPVNLISWLDAEDYCAVLARKLGLEIRLPTEAEWEYACRAGCPDPFSFSSRSILQHAWYSGNSEGRARRVGGKRPNAWGLYDMHGNVWEWCADWYSSDYYIASPNVDPPGPDIGDSRVMRGGAYRHSARQCRSANRDGDTPDARHSSLGFRIAIGIGTGELRSAE